MLAWLPEVASTYGPQIDRLFYIILYLTGGSLVLTEACLFWFAWKYRSREGRRARFIHGNGTLEVVWTIIPAIILAALTFASKPVWDLVHHTYPASDVNV